MSDDHDGRVIPYLIVSDAAAAMAFYAEAFGATEAYRLEMGEGTIAHAEMELGGGPLYLASDTPDMVGGPVGSPDRLGGTGVILHRYVPDVDAAVARAASAGARVVRAPEDQFYGDRSAVVADPWGHQWSLHTHLRDVSPDEMKAAMAQMG